MPCVYHVVVNGIEIETYDSEEWARMVIEEMRANGIPAHLRVDCREVEE